jgi:hypothetical protein
MLTDLAVRKATPREKPYKISDGAGLYLLVTAKGHRYWRMDYRFAEKRVTSALGVYPTISLAEAPRQATGNKKANCRRDRPRCKTHNRQDYRPACPRK